MTLLESLAERLQEAAVDFAAEGVTGDDDAALAEALNQLYSAALAFSVAAAQRAENKRVRKGEPTDISTGGHDEG